MRLTAINEGIGFAAPSYSMDQILGVDQSKGIISDQEPNFLSFFSGRNLYFTPEDRPEDVIRLEEAQRSSTLDALHPSEEALSSFTGRIHFGFKTVMANEYRDKALNDLLEPLDQAREIMRTNASVADLDYAAKQYSSQSPQARESGYEYDPNKTKILNDAIKAMYTIYNYTPIEVSKGVIKKRGLGHQRGSTPLSFRLSHGYDAINRHTSSKYVHGAAYALAKMLKMNNPPQDVKVIVDKFMEMCLSQVMKLNTDYDFVLYPESSSDFNKLFATELQSLFGADRLTSIMIKKLPGKEVAIDKEEMKKRALRNAQKAYDPKTKTYVLRLRSRDAETFDTPEQYAESWAQNEYEKLHTKLKSQLKSDKPLAIKGAQYLDKRRYIKLFGGTDISPISGKNVLIIDDNVVGGGTVELINDLAINVVPPPAKVDVFVPLYIVNY